MYLAVSHLEAEDLWDPRIVASGILHKTHNMLPDVFLELTPYKEREYYNSSSSCSSNLDEQSLQYKNEISQRHDYPIHAWYASSIPG